MELTGWKEERVKTAIFKAGDGGFLYIDLLSALAVLSLTAVVLFGGARNLREIRTKEAELYRASKEAYESVILIQIKK
jgi:hypothetical protein